MSNTYHHVIFTGSNLFSISNVEESNFLLWREAIVFCEFGKTPKILFPATMRPFLREARKKN